MSVLPLMTVPLVACRDSLWFWVATVACVLGQQDRKPASVCCCVPAVAGAPDRAAALTTALEGVMAAIVTHVSDKRGHIPPVGSSEVVSFPFDITITGSSSRGLGLSIGAGVGAVKRLLRTASPPPVLG